jgi:hypothetical protein
MARDGRWSEAIAVGSLTFVDKVKNELGFKALHREFEPLGDSYALRERSEAYARQFAVETEALSSENTFPWNERLENPRYIGWSDSRTGAAASISPRQRAHDRTRCPGE